MVLGYALVCVVLTGAVIFLVIKLSKAYQREAKALSSKQVEKKMRKLAASLDASNITEQEILECFRNLNTAQKQAIRASESAFIQWIETSFSFSIKSESALVQRIKTFFLWVRY
jgi:biopolymer transport protein ExbB/TolQ